MPFKKLFWKEPPSGKVNHNKIEWEYNFKYFKEKGNVELKEIKEWTKDFTTKDKGEGALVDFSRQNKIKITLDTENKFGTDDNINKQLIEAKFKEGNDAKFILAWGGQKMFSLAIELLNKKISFGEEILKTLSITKEDISSMTAYKPSAHINWDSKKRIATTEVGIKTLLIQTKQGESIFLYLSNNKKLEKCEPEVISEDNSHIIKFRYEFDLKSSSIKSLEEISYTKEDDLFSIDKQIEAEDLIAMFENPVF